MMPMNAKLMKKARYDGHWRRSSRARLAARDLDFEDEQRDGDGEFAVRKSLKACGFSGQRGVPESPQS